MLQFWKSGHKRNRSASLKSPTGNNSSPVRDCGTSNSNEKASNQDKPGPLASFDDEGLFDIGECEMQKSRSRLSKTLQEVLSDKTSTSYFIQFMEFRNASCYILCWLDIEAFKSDLSSDTRKNVDRTYSPIGSSRVEHDSLSVSTDCDSYTADSTSMCECSTTEPKSDLNGFCDSSSDKSSGKKPEERIIDQALGIFKKYVALESSLNIKCSEELRNEVMENICDTNKVISGHCFDNVQSFLYSTMENEYFNAFLGSDFFCKHQIEVLTSGNVVLEDILYNETALFYFMEYLEQEGQRSLLDFWIAATNFQQQLKDQKEFCDPKEAQSDAVVLYDKYFSLQAHCPLGFSDKVRFAVEQNICGENGVILDCFHLPIKIVEMAMEKNHFQSFLASQLFYKYLSELINTIHYNGYSSLSTDGKYSPSDCSSEKSFSTSTFLALEVTHNYKKKDKTTDMSIDTRELYDPDALWKRKRCHRLSLAKVTELGKYITEFDPEPDKKEFKLKEVVKKIVSHDEEEKKKEEMAWQVAEMIVKDITSVTLNDDKP